MWHVYLQLSRVNLQKSKQLDGNILTEHITWTQPPDNCCPVGIAGRYHYIGHIQRLFSNISHTAEVILSTSLQHGTSHTDQNSTTAQVILITTLYTSHTDYNGIYKSYTADNNSTYNYKSSYWLVQQYKSCWLATVQELQVILATGCNSTNHTLHYVR